MRPSCLRCEFCREERVGTLKVGDFLGITYTDCQIKNESNLSCIITHNTKNSDFLKEVKNILYEEVSFEDINRANICLHSSRKCEGWLIFEKLLRFLYPILGFNMSVRIINVIGKLYRSPNSIRKIISKRL